MDLTTIDWSTIDFTTELVFMPIAFLLFLLMSGPTAK